MSPCFLLLGFPNGGTSVFEPDPCMMVSVRLLVPRWGYINFLSQRQICRRRCSSAQAPLRHESQLVLCCCYILIRTINTLYNSRSSFFDPLRGADVAICFDDLSGTVSDCLLQEAGAGGRRGPTKKDSRKWWWCQPIFLTGPEVDEDNLEVSFRNPPPGF